MTPISATIKHKKIFTVLRDNMLLIICEEGEWVVVLVMMQLDHCISIDSWKHTG